MKHVMLDIETLGRKAGCPVLSIGAVVFDPYNPAPSPSAYHIGLHVKLNLFDSLLNGFEVDQETLKWWKEQDPVAQFQAQSDAREVLSALEDLENFFHQISEDKDEIQVWCQGANFDFPILAEYYDRLKIPTPWQFWMVRDTRTVYEICGFDPKSMARVNIYHNALDDAVHQVKCVQKAIEKAGLYRVPSV